MRSSAAGLKAPSSIHTNGPIITTRPSASRTYSHHGARPASSRRPRRVTRASRGRRDRDRLLGDAHTSLLRNLNCRIASTTIAVNSAYATALA